MCIVAAVLYGIAHDMVTARVCVEYFTVGHEPIFATEDPTLLAIGWGIIATWWVGLLLGVPLALVAQAGSRPKRSVGSLVRPVLWLLAVMGVSALAAGFLVGFWRRTDQYTWSGRSPKFCRPIGMCPSLPTYGRIRQATLSGSWAE
jgi:hypothetical protein